MQNNLTREETKLLENKIIVYNIILNYWWQEIKDQVFLALFFLINRKQINIIDYFIHVLNYAVFFLQ